MEKTRIGFIGCGNMARALMANFSLSRELDDLQVMASDINKQALESLRADGVKTTQDNATVAEFAEILFIAVKPDAAGDVLHKISPYIDGDKIVVSIMAGVPLIAIKAVLHKARKFVRCMPNIAAKAGKGMTGVTFDNLTEAEQADVLQLFAATGRTAVVPEKSLDIVTAVSGSGSAYVYLFIQALMDAATLRGLTEQEARLFAAQTVYGGAKMVLNSTESLDSMVAAVCSKGGTTIEAVNVFEESDFGRVIDRAVDAAYKKSKLITQMFKF